MGHVASQVFFYDAIGSFPAKGADSIIYVDKSNGYMYRWDGSAYVQIGGSSGGSATWGGITGTLSNQTDLQAALDAKQAAQTAYLEYSADVVCRVRSTANVATLSGLLTIDGQVLVAGDRVLLMNQTTASQNGVYVAASGAWTRAPEMDETLEFDKRDIFVTSGTTYAKTWWLCYTRNPTVGTTSLVFAQIPMGVGTGADQAAAGNHTHASLGFTSASSIGAAWSERFTSRTATASTATTDLVVWFSGSTAAQVETLPDGVAVANNSGRVLEFVNGGTVNWTLRMFTSNTLDGSASDVVLKPREWLKVMNTAVDTWVTVARGVTGLLADNVAREITDATSKTTPVDADAFGITDSAASNALKKLTWANLKATLKTYLDTLYVAVTQLGVANGVATLGAGATLPDAQLPNTGVTAGQYVNPTIILDAKGRATFAASGSSGGGVAAGLPVYFTNLASATVGSYKQISYENEVASSTFSAVVNNNEVLVQTYLFDADVGVTNIPAGVWSANFNAQVSLASGVSTLRMEVFVRASGGAETTLFSKSSDEINDLSYADTAFRSTQDDFTVLETDRVGVRIYAATTHNSNVTVSYRVGDDTASWFTTPLPLRHSLLRELAWVGSGHTGTASRLAGFDGSGNASYKVIGTDVAPATSGSAILKGNGAGGFSAAAAGTDYVSPAGMENVSNKTITGSSVNGVTLVSGGSASEFLNKSGAYSAVTVDGVISAFGTGADGALVVSSGTTNLNLGQAYNFSSISISAGATLSSAGTGSPLVLKCLGAANISGTISLIAKGNSNPLTTSLGTYLLAGAPGAGGNGGRGGYNTAGTIAGGAAGTGSALGYGGGGGGGAGSATYTGGAGGNGGTPAGTGGLGGDGACSGGNAYGNNGKTPGSQNTGFNINGAAGGNSAGGGGGANVSSNSYGGGGGAGGTFGTSGGQLILRASTISGTGTINLSGGTGSNGGNGGGAWVGGGSPGAGAGGGGGGGGGGGVAEIIIGSGSVFVGTVTTTGGAGGSGGTVGATGSTTSYIAPTSGSTGSSGSFVNKLISQIY